MLTHVTLRLTHVILRLTHVILRLTHVMSVCYRNDTHVKPEGRLLT